MNEKQIHKALNQRGYADALASRPPAKEDEPAYMVAYRRGLERKAELAAERRE